MRPLPLGGRGGQTSGHSDEGEEIRSSARHPHSAAAYYRPAACGMSVHQLADAITGGGLLGHGFTGDQAVDACFLTCS